MQKGWKKLVLMKAHQVIFGPGLPSRLNQPCQLNIITKSLISVLAIKNPFSLYNSCLHVCPSAGQANPRWPHIPEVPAVFVHWRNWYLAASAMFTNSLLGILLYRSQSCFHPLVPIAPTLSIHPLPVCCRRTQVLQPAGPPINASFKGQWSRAAAQTTFI